ncbi:hypothetical protein MYAM1_000031 [Malassezia yamatoensis]|uniref:Uncharacterized protein n=1 Tax=Malassezia yamatoensis TaxID=253288 RepID=A0AAJ5YNS6_9BASI|nr:hypothetical protein MYAM1_000031 [Malassezia yamatoensis]
MHDPRHQRFGGEGQSLAASADILRCYEEAVQEPMVECTNLDALYTNAQSADSDRMDACIMREDFCSTGVVARTWLTLRESNQSQGVDIDLEALQDSQKRWGTRQVRILQSPAYANASHTTELPLPVDGIDALETASDMMHIQSTWDQGQASARFERRLAKRQQQKANSSNVRPASEPRMTLLHSDVLDLPVPPMPSGETLEAPDLVAALNYAMAYFHDRKTLLAYLTSVKQSLRPHSGVFITDMFGGASSGEKYENQKELWDEFWTEPGFLRSDADAKQMVLDADRPGSRYAREANDDLQVVPAPDPASIGTRAEWPRGRLKLVRTGTEHGGFEYWREDGPIDYATNRFRMSLSFRFSDKSWLRDVFSYDFRIWSLRELTEALEEVGFASIRILVLPRNDMDSYMAESDSDGASDVDSDDGFAFLRRTEKEERQRHLL